MTPPGAGENGISPDPPKSPRKLRAVEPAEPEPAPPTPERPPNNLPLELSSFVGREVPRVGVGWYWFGPIVYVDTSDMWLEGRWPRIAVSLARPYADLVVGGLAALAAWVAPNAVLSAALWQFALVSYIGVLVKFNPLMEFDGYYILSDLLEKPNLRPRALAWLGSELIPALRDPERLRGHVRVVCRFAKEDPSTRLRRRALG
jgi:hypothetical protein